MKLDIASYSIFTAGFRVGEKTALSKWVSLNTILFFALCAILDFMWKDFLGATVMCILPLKRSWNSNTEKLRNDNVAIVSIRNSEENGRKTEAEVNKPLPGGSQPGWLAYNTKLELNWVCCNGKQQAVFMAGSAPLHMSLVGANAEHQTVIMIGALMKANRRLITTVGELNLC